jgi:hypothetical protein
MKFVTLSPVLSPNLLRMGVTKDEALESGSCLSTSGEFANCGSCFIRLREVDAGDASNDS